MGGRRTRSQYAVNRSLGTLPYRSLLSTPYLSSVSSRTVAPSFSRLRRALAPRIGSKVQTAER